MRADGVLAKTFSVAHHMAISAWSQVGRGEATARLHSSRLPTSTSRAAAPSATAQLQRRHLRCSRTCPDRTALSSCTTSAVWPRISSLCAEVRCRLMLLWGILLREGGGVELSSRYRFQHPAGITRIAAAPHRRCLWGVGWGKSRGDEILATRNQRKVEGFEEGTYSAPNAIYVSVGLNSQIGSNFTPSTSGSELG